MVHHTKKVAVDIFFIYGLSVCIIIVLSLVNIVAPKVTIEELTLNKEETVEAITMFDKSVFATVKTQAKAYIVYDLTTGEVIASKNETLLLPLASITKVMTAVSATLHKQKTDKITINPNSIEDSYDLGMKKNQVWSLGELLKYTLVFSSNDGAQAVSDSFGGDSVFLVQMNKDAKSLGLGSTFTDPAGRDEGSQIGGVGTVLDAAKLFAVARKNIPELLDATTKKRSTVIAGGERLSGIPNTNQEVEGLPGAEASKTGYTDMAGGNLGIIVDITIGHPVVLVVLGSTREGRFKDIDTLYTALQKSIR